MPVADILKELSRLSQEDLEKVRLRCVALKKSDYVFNPRTETEYDYIIRGIVHEMSKRGLLSSIYSPKLEPHQKQKALDLARYIERFAPTIRSEQRFYLGRVMAESLLDYLSWSHQDGSTGRKVLNIGYVLNNIHNIPAALDGDYPGYLRAGMISSLWGSYGKKR